MKNEFCIAIYTKDNSLYLSCDNIAEQESWLQALVELVEEERAGMPSSSFSSAMTQTISSTTVPRGQMPAGKPLFGVCWDAAFRIINLYYIYVINITTTDVAHMIFLSTIEQLFVEFCWEVVVTKFESKDGSHPRKCPRPNCAYRFCLTEELILLFKKLTKTTDPEDDWTFEVYNSMCNE